MKKIFLTLVTILIFINLINCTGIKRIHEKPIISINILDNIIKENVEPTSLEPNFGGKIFCDYMIIDTEKNSDTLKIYLYLYIQEYYLKDGELELGTGEITPAVLTVKQQDDEYLFLDCSISHEAETNESIKNFPKKIQKKYLSSGPFCGQSETTTEYRAKKYFNLDN